MKRSGGRQAAAGARITIITGARDSGKTRAAETLVNLMDREGVRVGGVIAPADLLDGVKVRIFFRDVLTGTSVLYAVRREHPVPAGVMAWTFLDAGLEFGRAAVRRAIGSGTNAAAVVIDEIGPLEMAGGGLWEPLREAVAGFPGRLILTVRPALLEALQEKLHLGPADVDVVLPGTIVALP